MKASRPTRIIRRDRRKLQRQKRFQNVSRPMVFVDARADFGYDGRYSSWKRAAVERGGSRQLVHSFEGLEEAAHNHWRLRRIPARQVRLPGWTHACRPIGGLDRSAAGGRSKGSQVSSSATSAALSLSASPEPAVQRAQSARQRFRPLPAYSFAVRILGLVVFQPRQNFG